jgi:GTP1/Obg family GTP-binding protein
MFLISAGAKWQQEISDSKESDMRRYEWLDRQEMKRLEQSFYEQTADLKCESDEYKNKLNTYRKSMAIYRDLLENAEKRRKMPKAPKSAETFRRN